MNLLKTFNNMVDKRLISPPKWMASNFHYLVYSGSRSYGCQQDESDVDVTGWCIPPKHVVFPHLAGAIQGFGDQGEKFESWQEHHCKDPNGGDKQYDFGVYNIVHYFKLLMDNNPDKLDTLFVPEFCISHITETGRLVRDNRKMFLHKGAFSRFRGYSMSQYKKMQSKEFTNEKRKADVEKYSYSTKFGAHLVRLLLECEQILVEGDLDPLRNKEVLKSIRRGDWTLEQITKWMEEKNIQLEKAYSESTLPDRPDEVKIKGLLINCLESHYGSLSNAVYLPERFEDAIRNIQKIVSNL